MTAAYEGDYGFSRVTLQRRHGGASGFGRCVPVSQAVNDARQSSLGRWNHDAGIARLLLSGVRDRPNRVLNRALCLEARSTQESQRLHFFMLTVVPFPG